MKSHTLKILPEYYTDIVTGIKPFEVRENDRDFKRGDLLQFKHVDDEVLYPGVWIITYVLKGGQFGIDPLYVVLGISMFNPPHKSDTLQTVLVKKGQL